MECSLSLPVSAIDRRARAVSIEAPLTGRSLAAYGILWNRITDSGKRRLRQY